MGTQITVKDVDEKTFHELKAFAVQHKMAVGSALSMAMHQWLVQLKKPKAKLSNVKPFKGGKETKWLSEKVDEVLYT